jgi:two-component system, OmpR family, response regulator
MRLLVVEDNQKLRVSLKQGLQQEGCAVDLAPDGAEARILIDAVGDGYDAVLMDRMLPDIDGIELCRSLRRRGWRVPVMVLTARDGVRDRVEGLDSGADDYLVKPFSFDELMARLRALMRRPRGPLPIVLSAGGVTLDPATREVAVAGRAVSLTAKEFGFLELLMRQPGRVFTREQITRSLWDEESGGYSNVVDVHVKNVRKKLAEAGADDSIETLRGAGYRIKG